jgi:hypothetical protein
MRVSASVVFVASLAACTDRGVAGEPPGSDSARNSAETPDPYERSPSRFGVVPLHAGFSPDPRVVGGTAIGEVAASSIHRKCKGWISETPDYLLDADTAFFALRVLGRSHADVVLVLRKPDGAVVCNDNRNGAKDPIVGSDIPIGTTQVWIGVQEKGATADYRLGFSEVKWHSSSIPLPDAD